MSSPGSAYFKLIGGKSTVVPKVDFDLLKKSIDTMLMIIEEGLVVSCHDLSDGGLAVSLAEMCIGGDFGADIDITSMGDIRGDFKLFSESNTRWLVEVKKENQSEFEEAMDIPFLNIGKIGGSRLMITDNSKTLVDFDVDDIRRAWNDTLWMIMG